LQGAQQLRLEQYRQLADFVEKERAAVGEFQQTDLAPLRAGEGPFLVTEELAFQ